MTATDSTPIIFIGPMASGKSSIGRRVAKLLGARFIDTDKVIVAEHGPIPALFEARGEAHFRAVEAETVARVLADPGAFGTAYAGTGADARRAIVALGGGAVLNENTQTLIEACRVVLVMTTEEAVLGRSRLENRPLLANDPAAWGRILAERLPLYERLAHVTFDTSARPKDAIAAEIAAWIDASETAEERTP